MSKWGDAVESAALPTPAQPQQPQQPAADSSSPSRPLPSNLPEVGSSQVLVKEELDPAVADGTVVLRTVQEYRMNDEGKRMLVTKKFRITKRTVKTNPQVDARARWPKFGDCAGQAPGPEPGVTAIDNEAKWQFKYISDKETAAKEAAAKKADAAAGLVQEKDQASLGILCRACGRKGEHWTHQCPYKDKLDAMGLSGDNGEGEGEGEGAGGAGASVSADGKYIPPGQRGRGDGAKPTSMFRNDDRYGDDSNTIRVTNLSEETTDEELEQVMRRFGALQRCFLVKDRETGIPRGHAFVNFLRHEDALRAVEQLSDRFGMHHLIIHCEMADESRRRRDEGRR